MEPEVIDLTEEEQVILLCKPGPSRAPELIDLANSDSSVEILSVKTNSLNLGHTDVKKGSVSGGQTMSLATSSSDGSQDLSMYANLLQQSHGRFLATARVKLPKATISARERFEDSLTRPGSLDVPLETQNFGSRAIPLQFSLHPTENRGIEWHTPTLLNSCNIDSFLTYVCVRQTRQPRFASRYFMLNSEAEQSLRRVFNIYNYKYHRSNLDLSLKVKQEWVTNLNLPQSTNGITDCVGSTSVSIQAPLKDSSSIATVLVCPCRTKDGKEAKGKVVVSNYINVNQPSDLVEFSENAGRDQPNVGRSYDQCSTCEQSRNILFFYIPSTTWFLTFEVVRNSHRWRLEDIPTTLEVNEVDDDNTVVTFEIGLILFSTEVSQQMMHQTSLQFHGQQWYFFDDMRNSGLLMSFQMSADQINEYIQNNRLTFEKIMYFRR